MEQATRKEVNPNEFTIQTAPTLNIKVLTQNGKPCFVIPDEYVEDIIAIISMACAGYNMFLTKKTVNQDDLTDVL